MRFPSGVRAEIIGGVLHDEAVRLRSPVHPRRISGQIPRDRKVDVGDSVACDVGDVPRCIYAAEIDRAVGTHDHAVFVGKEVFAVEAVLFLRGVIAEDGAHGHVSIGRSGNICTGRGFVRSDLVDVGDGVTGDVGNVPRRIYAAEPDRAVRTHLHARGVVLPSPVVEGVLLLGGVFAESCRNRYIRARRDRDVCRSCRRLGRRVIRSRNSQDEIARINCFQEEHQRLGLERNGVAHYRSVLHGIGFDRDASGKGRRSPRKFISPKRLLVGDSNRKGWRTGNQREVIDEIVIFGSSPGNGEIDLCSGLCGNHGSGCDLQKPAMSALWGYTHTAAADYSVARSTAAGNVQATAWFDGCFLGRAAAFNVHGAAGVDGETGDGGIFHFKC